MENKKRKINLKVYIIYFLVFVLISLGTLYYIYNILEKPRGFFIVASFSPGLIFSL